MHTHQLLMIEDDERLANMVSEYLGQSGLHVTHMADGVSGLNALQDSASGHATDLVILDLMLPDIDGLEVCRRIRTLSGSAAQVPILMLTAKGDPMDRVIGLEVGADDYLAKPFGPRELLARLRALLRRGHTGTPDVAQPAADPALPSFGPFQLDTLGRRLLKGSLEITLTAAEFDLLAALVARPNRVLSRDQLVDLLRGYDRDPFDRSIDNRVTRLRRKIEDEPGSPAYIRTVRGEGYLFNPRGLQP